MAEYRVRRAVMAVFVVFIAWLAGCAEERAAQFGVVSASDLKVGDYAPDFSFVGQNGQVETFAHVREVVTIVVFPVDPAWPNCDRCREIVQIADAASARQSPVAVVSIATPAKPAEECAAAMHRCAVKGQTHLVALHDHAGRVRAMYGSQAAGKYYVVDWTGRIAAMGPLSDRAGMEKAIRDAVEGHQKHWDEVALPPVAY